MNVSWKTRIVARRFAALTTAVVLLTGMVTGATASFANTEQTTSATESPAVESKPQNETPVVESETQPDMTEDETSSPEVGPETDSPSPEASEENPDASEEIDVVTPDFQDQETASSSKNEETADPETQMAKLNSPQVTVSKTSYSIGESVVAEGSGWNPNSEVEFTLSESKDGKKGKSLDSQKGTSSDGGSVAVTLTLPKNFIGSFQIDAKFDAKKKSDDQSASIQGLEVVSPSKLILTSDSPEYMPGSTVNLAGEGWDGKKRNVKIQVTDIEDKERDLLDGKGFATVDENGKLTFSFPLPADIYEFEATATEVADSSRQATVSFAQELAAVAGTITVRKAGIRTGNTTANGLEGAVFEAFNVGSSEDTTIPSGASPVATCTTDLSGLCNLSLPSISGGSDNFVVKEVSAPSGWLLLDKFSTGDYRVNVTVATGSTVQVPSSTRRWANAKVNPPLPDICGLNIALLFDESNSISDTEWGQMKDAAKSFVDALTGTPSRVALFSFASSAPAGTTKPLASVRSVSDATALKNTINAMSQQGGGTNWDAGLFQIAQSSENYDAVLFLTDGNPTFYSNPTLGLGNTTLPQYVEEAVHSANAVKAKSNGNGGGTRIIGVGIGIGGTSALNLAATTGPTDGSDYYTTDFNNLGQILKEVATKLCGGTITVQKQIGNTIPGSAGAESNGWPFTGVINSGGGAIDPTSGSTANSNSFDGLLQFKLSGGTWPKNVTVTETGNAPGLGDFTFADAQCAIDGKNVGTLDKPNESITFSMNLEDSVTCIFLNSPDTGTIELSKVWTGQGGQTTLQIGSSANTSNIAQVQTGVNGVAPLTTGVKSVRVGTYYLSEVGGLDGYAQSLKCTSSGSPITPNAEGGVLVGKGKDVKCTFTNTFKTGSLTIEKTITAPESATLPASYAVSYNCGTGFTGNTTISPTSPAVISGIPSGRTCSVTEDALTPIPGYTWGTPDITPASASIPNSGNTTITVANILTRDLGTLQITKTLAEGSAPFTGGFTINYECAPASGDEAKKTGSVTIAAGGTETVKAIPTGFSCTITEDTLPTAPNGFTWSTPKFTGSPALITKGETTNTSVENNLTAIPTPPPTPVTPEPTPVAIIDVVTPPPVGITPEPIPTSPEPPITPSPGTGVPPTTGVPTAVNAGDGPTSNDGFMLVMWLLLIATISTAVTWGLARWIDPEKAENMDKARLK